MFKDVKEGARGLPWGERRSGQWWSFGDHFQAEL